MSYSDIKTIQLSKDSLDEYYAKLLNAVHVGQDQDNSQSPVASHIYKAGHIINARYTVEELLGQGGMGVVYRVIDNLNPETPLALKVIHDSIIDPTYINLFKSEFKTMAECQHPNIAQVYNFGTIEDTQHFYFTMQYISGKLLSSTLIHQDIELLLDITIGISNALAYLHHRGIIHFDLKPENIFIDHNNVVKVLDFGITGVRSMQREFKISGTPAYMAPEIVNGIEALDHRYDLYSLGIILYELIAGQLPFHDDSPVKVLFRHYNEELNFDLPNFASHPAWIVELIKQLAAKTPSSRFPSATKTIEFINKHCKNKYTIDSSLQIDSYFYSSEFVGRDQELIELISFVDSRINNNPLYQQASFFVGASSGMGKSRLMKEVKTQIQLSKLEFIEANCFENSLSEFSPIVTIIEQLVHLARSKELFHIIDTYSQQFQILSPHILGSEQSSSKDDHYNDSLHHVLIERLTLFIIEFAEHTPITIYINDLQWAKSGTIDLLKHLLYSIHQQEQSTKNIPIAILGTYRDDEITDTPFAEILSDTSQEKFYNSIHLQHLDQEATNAIISSILNTDDIPHQFSQKIYEITSGNPYIIEEVVRNIVSMNHAHPLNNHDVLYHVDLNTLDLSRENIFIQRFNRLNAQQQILLRLLATYEKPITYESLVELINDTSFDIPINLSQLLYGQIIHRHYGNTIEYAISHDQIRSSVYKHIPIHDRTMLHTRIAENLEQKTGQIDRYIYELARHYYLSANKEKAFQYNLLAAKKAKRTFANNTSLALFESTQNLLTHINHPDSETLLQQINEHIGDLKGRLGNYQGALTQYTSLLSHNHTSIASARLKRKIGHIQWQNGEIEQSIESLWESVHLLGGKRPTSKLSWGIMAIKGLISHLLHRHLPKLFLKPVLAPLRTSSLELSLSYYRLAYAYLFSNPNLIIIPVLYATNIAERVGRSKELAQAYSMLGMVFGYINFEKNSQYYGSRAIAMAESVGSKWHLGEALNSRGTILAFSSQWVPAIEHLEQAKNILLDCGDMNELGVSFLHLSYTYYMRGDISKAIEVSTQGNQIFERSPSPIMGIGLQILQKLFLLSYGNHQKLIKELQNNDISGIEETNTIMHSSYGAVIGYCYLELQQYDRAIEHLQKAHTIAKGNDLPDYCLMIYPLLALAIIANAVHLQRQLSKDERKTTKEAIKTGLQLTKLRKNWRPLVLCAQALLAQNDGKLNQAHSFFMKAIDLAHALQLKWQVADITIKYARFYKSIGDDQQALQHLASIQNVDKTQLRYLFNQANQLQQELQMSSGK